MMMARQVVEVGSVTEAIDFVNARPKPLALYVFANDARVQAKIVSNTSSGGVTVNATLFHVGHGGLPFGGVGNSGIGAYHGLHMRVMGDVLMTAQARRRSMRSHTTSRCCSSRSGQTLDC